MNTENFKTIRFRVAKLPQNKQAPFFRPIFDIEDLQDDNSTTVEIENKILEKNY